MQQEQADPTMQQDAPPGGPAMVLFEAIARLRQVSAVYNGVAMQLAPHVLYTRDDMLYLGGIVTAKRDVPTRNVKFSIFKVAGLGDLTLLADAFTIDPDFNPGDPRYAATTVFVVEP